MLSRHLMFSSAASSCFLLVFAVSVEARLCGRVSADQAFTKSALIVKGSLISTTGAGAHGSDSISVIRIDRVLKGTTTKREISVTHFLCGIEYSIAMRKGRPLLAFVDASDHLVSGTAVLPASSRGAGGGSTDTKTSLRSELLLAATDEDASTARAGVGALAELDGPGSTATLIQAAKSADFGTRVRALTWLTRFGDANAFDQPASILSAPPFTPRTIPTAIRDDKSASLAMAHEDVLRALWSFAERSGYESTNPSTEPARFVQTLMRVARSHDLVIREAAIHALRGFKDPVSFSVLFDALDDPNRYIRYNAMVTLCMAMKAPDLPCPSVPVFERDERRYIGRVRAWWNTRR
jgi:hypothetical protein